jgi:hypothetical protein
MDLVKAGFVEQENFRRVACCYREFGLNRLGAGLTLKA